MNYQYIEQLLERYFLAESSCEEEQILKAFFRQDEVPEHLQAYASLFDYIETQQSIGLDTSFDRRLLDRLEAQGDAPVLHVKVKRMTIGERLKPLWRAAAVVAIVVGIGGAAQQASVKTSQSAIIGTSSSEAYTIEQMSNRKDPAVQPYRQAEESMKMAITADSTKNKKLNP